MLATEPYFTFQLRSYLSPQAITFADDIDFSDVVTNLDSTEGLIKLYEYYTEKVDKLTCGGSTQQLCSMKQGLNQDYQMEYIRSIRYTYAEELLGKS